MDYVKFDYIRYLTVVGQCVCFISTCYLSRGTATRKFCQMLCVMSQFMPFGMLMTSNIGNCVSLVWFLAPPHALRSLTRLPLHVHNTSVYLHILCLCQIGPWKTMFWLVPSFHATQSTGICSCIQLRLCMSV